jgi:DNA-binding MarR family transcriptional regulator
VSSSDRADLQQRLLAAGRELSTAAVMFHTALSAQLGLSPTEEKALDLLDRFGPLTAGELGQHSGLAPASVTGLVDRLQRKGFVHRRPHPDDRRRVLVEAVPDRLAAMAPMFDDYVAALIELTQRFDDRELAAIVEFMTEAAARQQRATERL